MWCFLAPLQTCSVSLWKVHCLIASLTLLRILIIPWQFLYTVLSPADTCSFIYNICIFDLLYMLGLHMMLYRGNDRVFVVVFISFLLAGVCS